jgi:single-stranded-DNA-specific exonuclease
MKSTIAANQKIWVIPEENLQVPESLLNTEKLPAVLASILFRRGIKNREELEHFIRPKQEHLHNPFLMKDMDVAIRRIMMAMSRKEGILIFGDYDVDGTTATALVYKVLRQHYEMLGYYIPDRYKEGYGISFAGIDHAKENGMSLIISLDCGIKAHDKVAYAKEKNIDFIICDHHLPGKELPDAVAILDPKRSDCPYPFKELSGCGVGYKLMEGLLEEAGWDKQILRDCLDMLALSIASDIVPVTGENRIFLHQGLQKINQNPSPGIQALLDVGGFRRNENGDYGLKTDRLVFALGPRINAAGRIGHGKGAVDLLLAENPEKAAALAESIDIQNTERKELDKNISQEAISMIESSEDMMSAFSTVLFRETWHKGVIGIVASRCIEKYHRPTVILTLSDGKLVGSGRSVPGFDLYAALDACSPHLIQFGGHFHAAGLTLLPENLEAFRQSFESEVRKKMTAEDLMPRLQVDACLNAAEINLLFYKWVDAMGPYGPGNMNPLFVIQGLKDNGQSRLLENKNGGHGHIKFSLQHPDLMHLNQSYSLEGIGFGLGEHWHLVESGNEFDLAFHLEENIFRERRSIQLMVKEIRPSAI